MKEVYRDTQLPELYQRRFQRHYEELKWLYFELYPDKKQNFQELCYAMLEAYNRRDEMLKILDLQREENDSWYRGNELIGMMFYVEQFADNLQGVEKKLEYLENSHINYIHLMPILDTVEGKSDGGYAVADFRKVQGALGTMDDYKRLAKKCHEKGISICLDFIMNHTSDEHEWAKKAKAGDEEYKARYYFFEDDTIPLEYEKHVPDVFPTTAPGNFTYIEECNQFVLTSFYPYQWDLNYRNPVVFNEMTENLLYLANQGTDIVRIDAVPYIWKQLGTDCRNLPQVHTIVRMIRMICEIVCPGTILLGEVVMEPKEVVPYFGTVEKPECHMLYNVTTMATTWHTVASKDTRLLKQQIDIISQLPKNYVFLNYLRCHDDIGWGLDYKALQQWGMKEVEHKQFLNDYFTGKLSYSVSSGELYNEDPITKDARFCGTTSSMCGIERGDYEHNEEKIRRGIQLDLMLHAYLFFQSGIPIIYSGDEIGQQNDWMYKRDKLKAMDSRYIHRGNFDWKKLKKIKETGTIENRLYTEIGKMESVRMQDVVFDSRAQVCTLETEKNECLCMVRKYKSEKIMGIFNFGSESCTLCMKEEAAFKNLLTNKTVYIHNLELAPYEYVWLKQDRHTG